MRFIADFHVHSKFSRATSKNLDFENLYIAARLKGITVVGTGDFTHPAWFSEIKEKLVPAEEGLFKLRDDLTKECDAKIPNSCHREVRFILVSEISNIYKKDQKTRKNHNLVFVPDFDTADKFNSKLAKIGNIESDGRPILGLDARALLEIVLEISEKNYLIPAHIWTPWFSLLGSKSGFDSIKECFEDLTAQIFAVETGLSSDPAMNWRVSDLDGLTLISNSDAHSPLKLGREANLFNTDMSYPKIKSAIKSGDSKQFLGTFEFYPEEGKYHLDGHRKCNVRCWPKETVKHKGICPVCGKQMTLGVLYRVEELADREEGFKPENRTSFFSVIPLTEILSEILKVGPGSKKVMQTYHMLLDKLGSEFEILNSIDTNIIEKAGVPLLGEAVKRMREKEINFFPGYDGEFGKTKIFNQKEREELLGQKALFNIPFPEISKKEKDVREWQYIENITPTLHEKPGPEERKEYFKEKKKSNQKTADFLGALNAEQLKAVKHPGRSLLIAAGPGTGKTRTLTYRIADLINEKKVSPANILAVTFTNKAAKEMETRLKALIQDQTRLPFVATFHSFCLKIIKENLISKNIKFTGIIDDYDRKAFLSEAIRETEKKGVAISKKAHEILDDIISAKQKALSPQDDLSVVADHAEEKILSTVYANYQRILDIQGLYDYEDLIYKVERLFETDEECCKKHHDIFRYIFIDEYQDLNPLQYRLVRLLAPVDNTKREICVIGDPNQSIYGFRGSDNKFFKRFITDFPDAEVITLNRNYRSSETILQASNQVIKTDGTENFGKRIFSEIKGFDTLSIIETATEKAEAVAVGTLIENLIGGMGFHSIDFNKTVEDSQQSRGFSDFAILYRTREQSKVFEAVFKEAGIPYQIASKESLFNQKGIQEIISMLKTIEGFGSYADLERIFGLKKSGVGRKTIAALKSWAYKNNHNLNDTMSQARRLPIPGMNRHGQRTFNEFVSDIKGLRTVMETMPVEEKLSYLSSHPLLQGGAASIKEEGFKDLLSFSKSFGSNSFGFVSAIQLKTDADVYDPQVERVSLMTMHAAKGLEFPIVFITGCENDFLPFHKYGKRQADIEEERRLFYVSITRAKEQIYITYAKKRRIYGQIKLRTISPFVADIEERLRKHETSISIKKQKENQVQLSLF